VFENFIALKVEGNFLKGLKQKVDIFVGTKNIFNYKINNKRRKKKTEDSPPPRIKPSNMINLKLPKGKTEDSVLIVS